MSTPWDSLDAGTQNKKLYLDPSVIPGLVKVSDPYEQSLKTVIGDLLNNTSGYGTPDNTLATDLKKAFDSRGTTLNTYAQTQLDQTIDFVQTAQDAAAAIPATDGH